jgi:serine protease Do
VLLTGGNQPSFADDADLAFEQARAAVVRGAMSAVEPSRVPIETIGGAQPLAEPNPLAPPAGMPGGRPGGRPGPRQEAFRLADGPTTGMIIDKDGLILTSSINFARNPTVITVTLADGSRHVARLLGVDFIRRLAVIRIETKDLPVCTWADLEEVQVGQYAMACGRGLGGTKPSASLGIISAMERRNGNAIQTDAKISPVNYGGPLVDIEGRVLGVIVPMAGAGGVLAGAEWYDSGIGFAVPKTRIDRVLDRLIAGETIEPGKIGVILQADEPSLLPFLDEILPASQGVKIREVATQSPAAEAGLKAGDRILAFDGAPVSDLGEVQRRLSDRAAGEKLRITVKRTFRQFDVTVTLARQRDIAGLGQQNQPPAPPEPGEEPPSTQPSSD